MDKEYLNKKWLAGDLSEDEQRAFEQIEDNDLLKQIVDKAPAFSASNFLEDTDYEALKIRMESENCFKQKKNWLAPILRIASIFIIAFGVYFLVFSNNSTTIESAIGEKKMVQLPDNSQVTLNAVSEISFNKSDWKNKRELSLNGEAYFTVAKGSTFDVLTLIGKVSVVGTQFNVKNRQDLFEVYCFEGEVKVTQGKETTNLLPGQVYRLISGKVSSDVISDKKKPLWIDNMSYFKKVPIREVIHELERQYEVEVTTDLNDENLLFTGGFSHDNLKEAIESITTPLKLSYIMESPTKVSLHQSE